MPKPSIAVLLGGGKPKEDEEEPESDEDDGDDDKHGTAAASKLREALKVGDDMAIWDAVRTMCQLADKDGDYEDEGEESGEE